MENFRQSQHSILGTYKNGFIANNDELKEYVKNPNRPDVRTIHVSSKSMFTEPVTQWKKYADIWDAIETAFYSGIFNEEYFQLHELLPRHYEVRNFFFQAQLIQIIASKTGSTGKVGQSITHDMQTEIQTYMNNLFAWAALQGEKGYHIDYFLYYKFFYLMEDEINSHFGISDRETSYKILLAIGDQIYKEVERLKAIELKNSNWESDDWDPSSTNQVKDITYTRTSEIIKIKSKEKGKEIMYEINLYLLGDEQKTNKWLEKSQDPNNPEISIAFKHVRETALGNRARGTKTVVPSKNQTFGPNALF